MRLGVDGERTLPARRVQQVGGGEVLRQLGTEPADLAQGAGAHGVVRADAHRCEALAMAELERPLPARLAVEPAPRGPGAVGVAVAYAGCGDIADRGVGERADHLGETARRGHMVDVELGDDVVALVSPVAVEVGEVALLAAGAPRPVGPLTGRGSAPRGHPHVVRAAPVGGLLAGGLLAQPYVIGVRVVLVEHRQQGAPGGGPGLRGRAGHDEGDRQQGNRQVGADPAHPQGGEEEVGRHDGQVQQDRAVDDQSGPVRPVLRLQPPRPDPDEAHRPAERDQDQQAPVAARQRGHKRARTHRALPPGPPEDRARGGHPDDVAVRDLRQVALHLGQVSGGAVRHRNRSVADAVR